jgi:hypothetical protein
MEHLTSTYLRQKRKRLIQHLQEVGAPVLRGSLIETYKRCGKPTCKCQKGKGHGPKYYLSISYPGRRPKMVYVPKELKDQVQTYLDNHQEMKSLMEQISEINRELLARRESF